MRFFGLTIGLMVGCASRHSDGKDGDIDTATDGVTDNGEPDADNDGLSDSQEAELGTDPNDADTDGDGLSDSDEVNGDSDPLQADADDDGLNDSEELAANTDPNNADTDGDGANDGLELDLETDPTDENSVPLKPDEGDWLLSNANVTNDGCNLVNVLGTFGTDIFAVLPEDYTVVNSTYERFQIDISSGNANCPIDGDSFICDTLPITEQIDSVGITISAEMNLEGTMNSATSMEATLSARLTNCDGGGCALLSFAGVSIPCDVSMTADGNL